MEDDEKFVLVAGNYLGYSGAEQYVQSMVFDIAHRMDQLDQTGRQFNGLFAVVCYFKAEKVWRIITDHLGFMPVYMYKDDYQCIIGSRIGLIGSLTSKLSWNYGAIQIYRNNGHFMFGECWFNEIKKIKAATVSDISVLDLGVNQHRYWTWGKIRPGYCGSIDEAIEIYHQLFVKGIARLSIDHNSVGLSLSGGLDSRYILSVARELKHLVAFSFGVEGTRDLAIAKKAADCVKVEHRVLKLKRRANISDRLHAFLLADGMLHLGHIHEAEVHNYIKEQFPIYFHGFYGGGIYAGSNDAGKRINEKIVKRHFYVGDYETQVHDSFYDVQSIDAYFADQKIRNESAHSLQILGSLANVLVPFYNMDWLEFNYSIPEPWQLFHKFYLKVLARKMEFGLACIPWQKTMLPVHRPYINSWMLQLKKPVIEDRIYRWFGSSIHFTNPVRLTLSELKFVDDFMTENSWLGKGVGKTFRQQAIDYSIAYYMTEMKDLVK